MRNGTSSFSSSPRPDPEVSEGPASEPFTPENAVRRRRELILMSIRDGGDRTPLAQTVFDELAIQIVEGRLLPGDQINSVDLAQQFGSSRTPVREALVALERQRVVVIPPRRRPYIAPVTSRHVRDVYYLRASLYALVSELIIDNYKTVPLDELWVWQEALEDDARRGDITSYFWHNVGFRMIEVKLSGSEDVQRIIADLAMRTLQFRHLSLSQPKRLAGVAEDHRRLLRAYEERDKDVAIAMSRGLVMAGYRSIKDSGFVDSVRPIPAVPQSEDEWDDDAAATR